MPFLKHGETKVASFKHTDATREVSWANILPFVAGEKRLNTQNATREAKLGKY